MQDKRDLEKFTKFLVLKAAQIIVQSRSGDKISMRCKPNSCGTDWFNLAIQDSTEVLLETKKVLTDEVISAAVPFCIEISLKTNEGDQMVLECWSLSVLPEHSDPSVRVSHTVYNRMGILLKSLLCVSRITPAYKLSRKQVSDSYMICYRMYKGEPQLLCLGDNNKHVRVGQLSTPVGVIHLSVFYRTKMTISPSQTGRDCIMLKSDHFHSDLSPKHARYLKNDDSNKVIKDIYKVGAFAANKCPPISEDKKNPDIPFSSLLMCRNSCPTVTCKTEASNTTQSAPTTPMSTSTDVDCSNGNEKTVNNNSMVKCNSQNGSRRSSCSMTSANDGFIMLDYPFAYNITNTNVELNNFYKDCLTAPHALIFNEEQTLAEQLGDLTKQLEVFETNMHQYEDFLSTLCEPENNN